MYSVDNLDESPVNYTSEYSENKILDENSIPFGVDSGYFFYRKPRANAIDGNHRYDIFFYHKWIVIKRSNAKDGPNLWINRETCECKECVGSPVPPGEYPIIREHAYAILGIIRISIYNYLVIVSQETFITTVNLPGRNKMSVYMISSAVCLAISPMGVGAVDEFISASPGVIKKSIGSAANWFSQHFKLGFDKDSPNTDDYRSEVKRQILLVERLLENGFYYSLDGDLGVKFQDLYTKKSHATNNSTFDANQCPNDEKNFDEKNFDEKNFNQKNFDENFLTRENATGVNNPIIDDDPFAFINDFNIQKEDPFPTSSNVATNEKREKEKSITASTPNRNIPTSSSHGTTPPHTKSTCNCEWSNSGNDSFKWNLNMGRQFPCCWLTSIIQGYYSSQTIITLEGEITLILIGRRSIHKPGTRITCRGIDDNGHVANFVETELAIILPNGYLSSIVMCRGSVPVFWEQSSVLSHPNIIHCFEMLKRPFMAHFSELCSQYGDILCVNLLNDKHEYCLTETFTNALQSVNKGNMHFSNNGVINNSESINGVNCNSNRSDSILSDANNNQYAFNDNITSNKGVSANSTLNDSTLNSAFNEIASNEKATNEKAINEKKATNEKENAYNSLNSISTLNATTLGSSFNATKVASNVASNERKATIERKPTNMGRTTSENSNMSMITTVEELDYVISYPFMDELKERSITLINYDFSSNVNIFSDALDLVEYISTRLTGFMYEHEHLMVDNIGNIVTLQNGCIRVNCLDCLDRTGAFQWCYGWIWMIKIFRLASITGYSNVDITINDPRASSKSLKLPEIYKLFWSEYGDAVSLFYAGTASIYSSYISQGSGNLSVAFDVARTYIERIRSHMLEDQQRSEAMELILAWHQIDEVDKKNSDNTDNIDKNDISFDDNNTKNNKPKLEDLKIWCGTWNIAGVRSQECEDLQDWLSYGIPHCDIYVFHIQELVELTTFRVLTNWIDPAKEQMIEEWFGSILKEFRVSYLKVRTISLLGLCLVVYAKSSIIDYITDIGVSSIKTGLNGNYGNKGAVAIRMKLDSKVIAFVNVHLPPGRSNSTERLEQMDFIIHNIFQDAKPSYRLVDMDLVIIGGDFNFRLQTPHDEILKYLCKLNIEPLLEYDEFISHKKNGIPPFDYMKEQEITFQPSYKFKKNSPFYDLRRSPSWCDRILFFSSNKVKITPLGYKRHERYCSSDHKPVSAMFQVV